MNHLLTILADLDAADLIGAERQFKNTRMYEIVIVFGAISSVVLVSSIFAIIFSRKKKRHKHQHHHNQRSQTAAAQSSESEPSEDESRGRRKSRRRRRPHRPLNPTLAQTGGLPPIRDPNTPLPPMP
jgi:hypothetical protein